VGKQTAQADAGGLVERMDALESRLATLESALPAAAVRGAPPPRFLEQLREVFLEPVQAMASVRAVLLQPGEDAFLIVTLMDGADEEVADAVYDLEYDLLQATVDEPLDFLLLRHAEPPGRADRFRQTFSLYQRA
jgi:hypothetical protein